MDARLTSLSCFLFVLAPPCDYPRHMRVTGVSGIQPHVLRGPWATKLQLVCVPFVCVGSIMRLPKAHAGHWGEWHPTACAAGPMGYEVADVLCSFCLCWFHHVVTQSTCGSLG